jgi:hypothetical protein
MWISSKKKWNNERTPEGPPTRPPWTDESPPGGENAQSSGREISETIGLRVQRSVFFSCAPPSRDQDGAIERQEKRSGEGRGAAADPLGAGIGGMAIGRERQESTDGRDIGDRRERDLEAPRRAAVQAGGAGRAFFFATRLDVTRRGGMRRRRGKPRMGTEVFMMVRTPTMHLDQSAQQKAEQQGRGHSRERPSHPCRRPADSDHDLQFTPRGAVSNIEERETFLSCFGGVVLLSRVLAEEGGEPSFPEAR